MVQRNYVIVIIIVVLFVLLTLVAAAMWIQRNRVTLFAKKANELEEEEEEDVEVGEACAIDSDGGDTIHIPRRRPPSPTWSVDPDLEPIDPSVYDGHDPTQTRLKGSTGQSGYSFIAFRPPPPPRSPPELSEQPDGDMQLGPDDDEADLVLPELSEPRVRQPSHVMNHGLITPPPSPPILAKIPEKIEAVLELLATPPSLPDYQHAIKNFARNWGFSRDAGAKGHHRSQTIGTIALNTSHMVQNPIPRVQPMKQKRDTWLDNPDEKPRTVSGKIRWEDSRDSWF